MKYQLKEVPGPHSHWRIILRRDGFMPFMKVAKALVRQSPVSLILPDCRGFPKGWRPRRQDYTAV